jgi:hypothetical protein
MKGLAFEKVIGVYCFADDPAGGSCPSSSRKLGNTRSFSIAIDARSLQVSIGK